MKLWFKYLYRLVNGYFYNEKRNEEIGNKKS